MKLLLEPKNNSAQCLKMLEEERRALLDDIHFREKQISTLDYLRYQIRSGEENTI